MNRRDKRAMNKKPEYIITWGNSPLSNAGYGICGSAHSKAEALRKIRKCDKTPGSAKRHRLFIAREINIGKKG
jgi:hypothetical protein